MICEDVSTFLGNVPSLGALAGLDLGTGTIGGAVSDVMRGVATPTETIKRRKFGVDAAALLALCDKRQITGLVLGLPLNMDGSESESSQRARKFARRLHGRFGIRVWMIDERLSTREARERTGTRRADPKVDSMAAAVIAEGYLGGATPVAP